MLKSDNVLWHEAAISAEQRAEKNQHSAAVIWFTGLSGSGKSTIANHLSHMLFSRDIQSYLLDGDNVRHGLNGDLGFDDDDRVENIRRVAEVAALFADAGLITLTAFISPFAADRAMAQKVIGEAKFIEVFIDTSLDVCELRDPKGLYKRARRGEILNFTAIDSVYEMPLNPAIHVKTTEQTPEQCAVFIYEYLIEQGILSV